MSLNEYNIWVKVGNEKRVDITDKPSDFKNRFEKALQRKFMVLGKLINDQIIRGLEAEIKERPRNQDYRNGDSTPLERRLIGSRMFESNIRKDRVALELFKWDLMDKRTRNEGQRTSQQGWFTLFADGHEGRDHGSSRYAFMPKELAYELIERCAESMGEEKKREWTAEKKEVFRGRHDEGIMVKMDDPLFFDVPDFGKSGDFVGRGGGHPGYNSWKTLVNTYRQLKTSRSAVLDAVRQATLEALR